MSKQACPYLVKRQPPVGFAEAHAPGDEVDCGWYCADPAQPTTHEQLDAGELVKCRQRGYSPCWRIPAD
jgi:hypothetical protein